MSENKINNIVLKNADSKEEKMLLGLLSMQASRMDYGQIIFEVTFREGKIDLVRVRETEQTFRLRN